MSLSENLLIERFVYNISCYIGKSYYISYTSLRKPVRKLSVPGLLQSLVLNEKTLYPNVGVYFFGFTFFF